MPPSSPVRLRARRRGRHVIDADLQNPPEEIPRLLARSTPATTSSARGAPRVSTVPAPGLVRRGEPARIARGRVPHDGLRLDAARVPPARGRCGRPARRSGALHSRARRVGGDTPTEIAIAHEPRAAGRSRYSRCGSCALGFDLMTGSRSCRSSPCRSQASACRWSVPASGSISSFDAWSSVLKARVVHALRDPVRLPRAPHLRRRPGRRVRRPHLRRGTPPALVRGARRPWRASKRRAVDNASQKARRG